ncbi:MAG: hypothetical protein KGD73_07315 [Candidatus Lokiarchaeota archaeon]|nr:hypothetical protein [Candidatus Lokiarchaeota archaeon]
MRKTAKDYADRFDPNVILDYYKDWSSENSPVMMVLDNYYEYPGDIESEDLAKMAYLRKKYQRK